MTEDVLKVENLTISYPSSLGLTPVVSDVSFRVKRSEIVGLVGESGSGKTQVSLSVIRLLSEAASISSKGVFLKGENIFSLDEKKMCGVRGDKIAMIFQEPMTSLNPVFSIGYQIEEAITCHRKHTKKESKRKALKLLELVKIPDPEEKIKKYPHELSGGMRQRVLIAMALASEPELLIADEPTTALDVTTQAQILELLKELQRETGVSILFITHDLGIVAELCDYVLVMYAGRIVEKGSVKSIFTQASHPYTRGLLDSVPKLGEKLKVLPSIPGFNKTRSDKNHGCSFLPRCFLGKKDPCSISSPKLQKLEEGHSSSCFFTKNIKSQVL